MQHMSPSDGIAVHHRNHRLGQPADLHLHIEHRETRHTLVVHIAASPFHMHVATRAESVLHVAQALALRHFRHRTSQKHHIDVLHLATHRKSLTQLIGRLWRKGVAIVRPIDRNLRNTIIFLEENLLELTDGLPLSFFHILTYL